MIDVYVEGPTTLTLYLTLERDIVMVLPTLTVSSDAVDWVKVSLVVAPGVSVVNHRKESSLGFEPRNTRFAVGAVDQILAARPMRCNVLL